MTFFMYLVLIWKFCPNCLSLTGQTLFIHYASRQNLFLKQRIEQGLKKAALYGITCRKFTAKACPAYIRYTHGTNSWSCGCD